MPSSLRRTYLDRAYREALLNAVEEYERRKPRHSRLEEVAYCREIINAFYHTNVALVLKLRKYLATMRTGFNFLGIKRLHINTGRSLLKHLIEEAIAKKSLESMLEAEGRAYHELVQASQEILPEELMSENESLSRQLKSFSEDAQQKFITLEQKVAHAELRYKEILEEKKAIQLKYLEAMNERAALATENITLQQTIISLNEENQQLKEKEQSRLSPRSQGSESEKKPRGMHFQTFFGGRPRRRYHAHKKHPKEYLRAPST